MISAYDKTFKLDIILSIIDWLTFNLVLFICCLIGMWSHYDNGEQMFMDILISNIAYIIALQFVAITLHHRQSQLATILSNTSRTAVLYVVLNAAILGMMHSDVPGFFRSALMAFIVFVITSVERVVLRDILKRKRTLGQNRVNTVLVGTGDMIQKAADVMTNVWNGYNLLGSFSNSETDRLKNNYTNEDIPYLGTEDDLIKYLETHDVVEVYVSMVPNKWRQMKALLAVCESRMIRPFFVPAITYNALRKTKIRDFGDIYVMAKYNEPLRDVRNRMKKRAFDIVVSLAFICTLFPIILVVVAIISKITMPGPLFFKQKRTGYDGRDFTCYKFRSMKVNKDSDKVQATKDDPRVTKWGLFMRHYNIDELPQFINVLIGDMSLVGPRPHMLAHTDYYSKLISDYMIRHYVKPGITGWAQTHGERGETKTVEDMQRRVEKDIWYIEHWSVWLDVQIMIKTVKDAIHGDDKAY